MGQRDSTATRVAPVFDALSARDATGETWLSPLLSLPELPGRPATPRMSDRISSLEDSGWGARERRLPPPPVLLQWLACCANPAADALAKSNTSPATIEKRRALFGRDPDVIGEALALLNRPGLPASAWYVLEGVSQPDVYLQTEQMIVVIEGKRTEPGATTGTDWMPGRHQMLRHIDCAWELRGSRRVYGFFIVEGAGGAETKAVPPTWADAASATVGDRALRESLPHRTVDEREVIARCFLGVTTWQRVCEAFRLDWAGLPDRVVGRGKE